MSKFSEYVWPPLQIFDLPSTTTAPTGTGGFAIAPNWPNLPATSTSSAIPPSVTVWSAAPPPVNTQVLYSSVLTQQQIDALFNVQNIQLENQAP